MFGWIAAKWATRTGKPLMIALAILLLLAGVFALGRCTGDDNDAEAQTEQTNRSSDAVADAAANAVETLENRVATEDAIDQAVERAVEDIGTAASPQQIENIVTSEVCGKHEHRNDPACTSKAETRVKMVSPVGDM